MGAFFAGAGWGALGRPHSWGHSSLGQASTRLQPAHPSEARTLLPPRLRVRRQISTPEIPLSRFPIRFRHGPSVARYSALLRKRWRLRGGETVFIAGGGRSWGRGGRKWSIGAGY